MRVAGQTAGWFADPAGRFRFRYWDGGQWTDQVLTAGREESTDPLEPELRVQPPRPVLPDAPAHENLGGAPVVTASADFGPDDRRLRIPRPTPGFFVAVLLVALLVAGTVWLLGQLNGGESNQAASMRSQITGGIDSSYPAIQRLGVRDGAGLDVVVDPTLPGARRVRLADLGMSIAVPSSWFAVSGSAPEVQQAAKDNGSTAKGLAALAKVKLYAVDPVQASVGLVVMKLPPNPSLLHQADQLKQEIIRSVPNVVAGEVIVTHTKIGGMNALQLEVPILAGSADGGGQVVVIRAYFVPVHNGVADISMVSRQFDLNAGGIMKQLADNVKKLS